MEDRERMMSRVAVQLYETATLIVWREMRDEWPDLDAFLTAWNASTSATRNSLMRRAVERRRARAAA